MMKIDETMNDYAKLVKENAGATSFTTEDLIDIAEASKGNIYAAITYALGYGYMTARKDQEGANV